MFSLAVTTISLVAGYAIVAGLIALTTFGLASMMPILAVANGRLRGGYKLLTMILWLIFSALGAYVACTIATMASPRNAAAALAIVLLIVVWRNKSETKQTGLLAMLGLSLCIIAGVAAGFVLRTKQIS